MGCQRHLPRSYASQSALNPAAFTKGCCTAHASNTSSIWRRARHIVPLAARASRLEAVLFWSCRSARTPLCSATSLRTVRKRTSARRLFNHLVGAGEQQLRSSRATNLDVSKCPHLGRCHPLGERLRGPKPSPDPAAITLLCVIRVARAAKAGIGASADDFRQAPAGKRRGGK